MIGDDSGADEDDDDDDDAFTSTFVFYYPLTEIRYICLETSI